MSSFWLLRCLFPKISILNHHCQLYDTAMSKIISSGIRCWDQPWDFFGRNDTKAETPVLWPPHVKSWLIGKDSDVGRDGGQEEKGTAEDETAGWQHWLDEHESDWTLGIGDGQGGLACCNSWGHKESDTTERLNWTEAWRFLFQKALVAWVIPRLPSHTLLPSLKL